MEELAAQGVELVEAIAPLRQGYGEDEAALRLDDMRISFAALITQFHGRQGMGDTRGQQFGKPIARA